jgi:Domain of unknown function (DUF4440)
MLRRVRPPEHTSFVEWAPAVRERNVAAVSAGARTPEELETLLEDAFVVRDHDAIARLFEAAAVLVTAGAPHEARGAQEIARVATEMWGRDRTYLADPRRVLQAHDTALVLTRRAINVVRRGGDGTWRYAISLLGSDDHSQQEHT